MPSIAPVTSAAGGMPVYGPPSLARPSEPALSRVGSSAARPVALEQLARQVSDALRDVQGVDQRMLQLLVALVILLSLLESMNGGGEESARMLRALGGGMAGEGNAPRAAVLSYSYSEITISSTTIVAAYQSAPAAETGDARMDVSA